jgi:hypothetical protein
MRDVTSAEEEDMEEEDERRDFSRGGRYGRGR